VPQTTERAIETFLESILYNNGWHPGNLAEWSVERALFPACTPPLWKARWPNSGAELRALEKPPFDEPATAPNERTPELAKVVSFGIHVLIHDQNLRPSSP